MLGAANLVGADLSKADLSRAVLAGANLAKADLRGVNLGNANLRGANFRAGANLLKADLTGADLTGADLTGADLTGADLVEANLVGANLVGANLRKADLRGADLNEAILVETGLVDAILTDCRIYGISAWNVRLGAGTKQQGLIITPGGEPEVTVDDLEVAQFVYLLLQAALAYGVALAALAAISAGRRGLLFSGCWPRVPSGSWRAAPAGSGWLHEMKHDGFRILARKHGERVEVWSRRGALFNDRFPSIAEAVGALPVANALIDGEAVTFRPDGHSDFAALRTKEGGERASFVAFDLLDLEGDDLRDRPLEERREALARLVHGADGIRFSEALSADGVLVFAHACKLGLEGIVSKRVGSRYRSGTSRNWLKVLNPEFERREGLG